MKKPYKDKVNIIAKKLAVIIDKTKKELTRVENTQNQKDYDLLFIQEKALNVLLSFEIKDASDVIPACNEVLLNIYQLYKRTDDITNDPSRLKMLELALERTAYVLAQASQTCWTREKNGIENKVIVKLPEFLRERQDNFNRLIIKTKDDSTEHNQLSQFICEITMEALTEVIKEHQGETEESHSILRPC